MQVWCNGSTTVSKTVCSSSNLLTCAKQQIDGGNYGLYKTKRKKRCF